MITDEQIRRVQAQNAERDAARARQKKLAEESLATCIDEKVQMIDSKPIGKTLMEIFSKEDEEKDDPTDPGTSLMEILSQEDADADHG